MVRWVRYPAEDMQARVRRARAVSGTLCLTTAPKIRCIFFIPKRHFLVYNLRTCKDVFLQRVSKCWMYNLPSRKGGTEQGAGIEDPDQSVTSCQWAAESRHLEDEGDHGRWLGTLGESQQEAVSGVITHQGPIISYLWRHWTIALLSQKAAVWVHIHKWEPIQGMWIRRRSTEPVAKGLILLMDSEAA